MLGAVVFLFIIAFIAAMFRYVDIAGTAVALLVIGLVAERAYQRSHSRVPKS